MSDYYHSCAIPKGRPPALLKKDRDKRKESIEEREDKKVRKRSGGQCEVREQYVCGVIRCTRAAREVHHFLGGIGRRGVRESALAQNKLHVCAGFPGSCHSHITSRILQPHWRDVNDRAGTTVFVRLR